MTPLEQKIRKHCKELQALTFGCEVKAETMVGFAVRKEHEEDGEWWTILWKNTGHINTYHINELEIIGHPIEWSHVLRAIEYSGNESHISSGGYMTGYSGKNDMTYDGNVDLSLPFSQQSPEVHKFINELID